MSILVLRTEFYLIDLITRSWPYDLPKPAILRVSSVAGRRDTDSLTLAHRRRLLPQGADRAADVPSTGVHSAVGPPATSWKLPCELLAVMELILIPQPTSLLHAIIAITAPHLPPWIETSPAYAPLLRGPDEPPPFFDLAPPRQACDPPLGPQGRYQAWHRRKAMDRLAEQTEALVKPIAGLQCESMRGYTAPAADCSLHHHRAAGHVQLQVGPTCLWASRHRLIIAASLSGRKLGAASGWLYLCS